VETVLSTEELDVESADALAELVIGERTCEVTTGPITDQLNRVIRTVNGALVSATTREEGLETLTERQREALEAACRAGYFMAPRQHRRGGGGVAGGLLADAPQPPPQGRRPYSLRVPRPRVTGGCERAVPTLR